MGLKVRIEFPSPALPLVEFNIASSWTHYARSSHTNLIHACLVQDICNNIRNFPLESQYHIDALHDAWRAAKYYLYAMPLPLWLCIHTYSWLSNSNKSCIDSPNILGLNDNLSLYWNKEQHQWKYTITFSLHREGRVDSQSRRCMPTGNWGYDLDDSLIS